MGALKEIFKSKYFIRTLLTYFAVLLTLTLSFLFTWSYRVDTQNEAALRLQSEARAADIVNLLDQRFRSIDDMGWRIFSSNWGARIRSRSDVLFGYFDIFRKQEISNDMLGYEQMLSMASHVFIIIPERGLVVAQNGWWRTDEYLVYLGIRKPGERILFGDLIKRSRSLSAVNLRAEGIATRDTRTLLLFRSLDNSEENRAILGVLADGGSLDDFVGTLAQEQLTQLRMVRDAQPLYQYQSRLTPGKGETQKTITLPSALFPWQYEVTLRQFVPVNTLKTPLFITGLVFGVGVISILVAYLLSLFSYRPIRLLLSSLGLRGYVQGSEFYSIKRSFDDLRDQRQILDQRTQAYYHIMRNNFLQNLLQGYFDEENIAVTLERCGLNYHEQQYFLVTILHLPDESADGNQEPLPAFMAIRHMLEEHAAFSELFQTFSGDRVVFFAGDQERDLQHCGALLDQIGYHMYEAYHIDMLYSMGSVEKGLVGVSKSYQNARQLGSNRYYYPTDWEIQFINYLKVGHLSSTLRLIDEIRKENQRRNLPEVTQGKLITQLAQTLLRVMREMDIAPDKKQIPALEETLAMDARWSALSTLAETVCSRTLAVRESAAGRSTAHALVVYLQGNYSNYELTLQYLSDQFHLSIATISRIFKSAVKLTFYEYLTLLRVEKAKELLQGGGQTPIHDIARQVGYANVQSFNRAFSRCEGISPREYAASTQSGEAKG